MSTPEIRGVNHVGMTVPDIEAAKAFLIEAFGAQLLYQSKVCYCQMPWGTTMEFITTPDEG